MSAIYNTVIHLPNGRQICHKAQINSTTPGGRVSCLFQLNATTNSNKKLVIEYGKGDYWDDPWICTRVLRFKCQCFSSLYWHPSSSSRRRMSAVSATPEHRRPSPVACRLYSHAVNNKGSVGRSHISIVSELLQKRTDRKLLPLADESWMSTASSAV